MTDKMVTDKADINKLRVRFSIIGLGLIRMLSAEKDEQHILPIRNQIRKLRQVLDDLEQALCSK